MKKLLLILACSLMVHAASLAQGSGAGTVDQWSLGIGGGFDYGGLGVNITYYPLKSLGFFAGGGYAVIDFGYNVGVKYRYITEKQKINPFAVAMYGYNAALEITNFTEYNKMFYGPTFGAGIDFRFKDTSRGYWSLALMVPVRGDQIDNYLDDLRENYYLEVTADFLPVGISLGYRFRLK